MDVEIDIYKFQCWKGAMIIFLTIDSSTILLLHRTTKISLPQHWCFQKALKSSDSFDTILSCTWTLLLSGLGHQHNLNDNPQEQHKNVHTKNSRKSRFIVGNLERKLTAISSHVFIKRAIIYSLLLGNCRNRQPPLVDGLGCPKGPPICVHTLFLPFEVLLEPQFWESNNNAFPFYFFFQRQFSYLFVVNIIYSIIGAFALGPPKVAYIIM